MPKDFILKNFEDIEKAASLLGGSVKKYKPYSPGTQYTPRQLEYYDALSFRYEKTIEVALYFFRSLESYLYSAESDTLRNRLLTMEKIGVIDSAEKWLEARLLRNRVAHAYPPVELKSIYAKIIRFSGFILTDLKRAGTYVRKL